jgi:hypothetical protein
LVCSFPTAVKKVVHPLITCFVLTDVCAALLGWCSGVSPEAALTSFLTRGKIMMIQGTFGEIH